MRIAALQQRLSLHLLGALGPVQLFQKTVQVVLVEMVVNGTMLQVLVNVKLDI